MQLRRRQAISTAVRTRSAVRTFRKLVLVLGVLAANYWVGQFADLTRAESPNVSTVSIDSGTSQRSTEVEKIKAQAETVKAEADMVRAQAEAKKAEVDQIKAVDAKWQFYFDFSYRVLLSLIGVGLLVWLFPQVQEFSFPWGSGTATVKRAPKQPGPSAPPSAPSIEPLGEQAIENLKKRLVEDPDVSEPAAQGIIGSLEEAEEYSSLGIARDSIYICHRARKIPRSDYYQVQIYLDADEPATLDKIEKVIYHLHPTFPERQRLLTNRNDRFQLEIKAWGEFMLYALVYFKSRNKPVRLKRYLNF